MKNFSYIKSFKIIGCLLTHPLDKRPFIDKYGWEMICPKCRIVYGKTVLK